MTRLNRIIANLSQGINDITRDDVDTMNLLIEDFLDGYIMDLRDIHDILQISNILYNNSSGYILPLDDGLYDLAVVKYDKMTGNNAPVGAIPTKLIKSNIAPIANQNGIEPHGEQSFINYIPEDTDLMYYKSIVHNQMPSIKDAFDPKNIPTGKDLGKIKHNVKHAYPELVGTIHKCKFTMVSEAEQAGKLDDPSVKIFERDFLYPTFGFAQSFANARHEATVKMVAELKYDGVSIEAEVDGDEIISAVSRGDTANDIASDYTPIFAGKKFHKATGKISKGRPFGIKFEAIITEYNMDILARVFGKSYKNCRVAIIGILGSSDAYKYRDLITLVPIRTAGISFGDPIQEIRFLNQYYTSDVDMKYAFMEGDYYSLLWQIDRFTKEAEQLRPMIPFMYDGVVISYIDPELKSYLGRKNDKDEWSMAIKFNAMSKDTIFTGYTFTIGQNGLITPMGHFKPVEFLGSIHDKTTVHSYKRFKDLNLRIGDIVRVTYRNDVICYLDKPYNPANANNTNPPIPFITNCPSCGSPLTRSDSGDSMYCLNPHCPERNTTRIANMVRKLGMKDFSRAYLTKLEIHSLSDLLNLDREKAASILGSIMGNKISDRIKELITVKMPDYRVMGSLGFSSISGERWKLILNNIPLDEFVNGTDDDLRNFITMVPGMGTVIAKTIVNERPLFIDDIKTILSMPNVVNTYRACKPGLQNRKAVRFTGIRSKELEDAFNKAGFDADGDKSVTKKTSILIVPYPGFVSSKVKKASDRCLILSEDQAWQYLKGVH